MPKWNIASRVTSKQSSEKPDKCYLKESRAHNQASRTLYTMSSWAGIAKGDQGGQVLPW